MEATEEDPAATDLTTNRSKKHVQCKLLETIYEDPKCTKDGKEQYTSVRKYKRFIDFNEAPNHAKRWKRTQKAFKLASSRRVTPVDEPNGDISDTAASTRPTRNCTRHRIPNTTIDLVSSNCRKRKLSSSGIAVCDPAKPHHVTQQQPHQTTRQEASVQIVVLENGGVPIEECATVEVPAEGSQNGMVDGTVLTNNCVESDRTIQTVEGTVSTGEWLSPFQDSVEDDVKKCMKCVLDTVVPHFGEPECITENKMDSTSYMSQPRHIQQTEIATAAQHESDIANVVSDLATVVETTHFLRDMSSTVADHVADISRDNIEVVQVVYEVVEVVSSEEA